VWVPGGQFDFSRTGTFAYLSGKSSTGTSTLVWPDSDGKTQPLMSAPGVQIYDLERGNLERVSLTGRATNYSPVWTPDGKHIVVESQGISTWSLRWTRADGTGETQSLIESQSRRSPYSFSHDGKRLAFPLARASGPFPPTAARIRSGRAMATWSTWVKTIAS
jgi:Tol biopolymer transport system component